MRRAFAVGEVASRGRCVCRRYDGGGVDLGLGYRAHFIFQMNMSGTLLVGANYL